MTDKKTYLSYSERRKKMRVYIIITKLDSYFNPILDGGDVRKVMFGCQISKYDYRKCKISYTNT